MSSNPYPENSPSWREWEKQAGRAPEQAPAPSVGLPTSDDDWDLGPACGLEPDICESCQ